MKGSKTPFNGFTPTSIVHAYVIQLCNTFQTPFFSKDVRFWFSLDKMWFGSMKSMKEWGKRCALLGLSSSTPHIRQLRYSPYSPEPLTPTYWLCPLTHPPPSPSPFASLSSTCRQPNRRCGSRCGGQRVGAEEEWGRQLDALHRTNGAVFWRWVDVVFWWLLWQRKNEAARVYPLLVVE